MLKAVIQTTETIREQELTPAEVREALLQLSRKKLTESGARPAINALGKIMCDAASASQQSRGGWAQDKEKN
ncbi:MAG: hypothetical protein ACR2G4_08575 [Pyrinomonadaceae bacterium]